MLCSHVRLTAQAALHARPPPFPRRGCWVRLWQMTHSQVDAIRAARAELDGVIGEIRRVDGFERFLSPPTFDDVSRVASPSPLVYVTVARFGGLALVVRGSDVTHISLDTLTDDQVRGRVEAHLTAYRRRRDGQAEWAAWGRSLDLTTRWLWEEAMGPVLTELGKASEVFVVAGGLLGLLPLHAAWTEDGSMPTGRRYAVDQLSFSYAPSARALEAARELAAAVPCRNLLAVVDPAPVPAKQLPYARWEAMGFRAVTGLPGADLPGRKATPIAFTQAVSDADVLLLACHGRANLEQPLESGLLLAGGRVTLRDLMEMRLQVRLAVLSACETALPGTDLPDEVVGLPTGLLQAGVAGVVASQWAVPDRATAMLMTEFGRVWAGGLTPAAALRQAQRWLRDTTNDQKLEHWLSVAEEVPALAPVVEEFEEWLSAVEPEARDHAHLGAWAVFAHVGA